MTLRNKRHKMQTLETQLKRKKFSERKHSPLDKPRISSYTLGEKMDRVRDLILNSDLTYDEIVKQAGCDQSWARVVLNRILEEMNASKTQAR